MEAVHDMLAEHQNQIRYLKLVHDTQKRRVRIGQLSTEHPLSANEQHKGNECEGEELLTPLRYPSEHANDQRELHK